MLFGLTLLCTSQGLVMAERSQAVIIMALKTQADDAAGSDRCRTVWFAARRLYSHDNFLPGGFQRHEVHPLLFLLVRVREVHNLLKHGSFSARMHFSLSHKT